ncbi:MAG: PD-(D/E)XK nuclease domain-containing protein [Deltaproteobacteria bacterium]|jgi:hypothetical protein|nr:PD-(D/E)XK nuclease domain-containing protein [Deltaproteobacteria bacterium]
MLQVVLKCLTFEVSPEVLSAEGRSDLELTLSDGLKVIIELKYIPAPNVTKNEDLNKARSDEIGSVKVEPVNVEPVNVDADGINKKLDQAVQAALTQIEEKKYAQQYLGHCKVLKMGLAIYHRADIKIAFGPDQEKTG